MSIEFNSKSEEPWCYLSNFYGSTDGGIPEFEYQAQKFKGGKIHELINQMATCSGKEFVKYLMALQPHKQWSNQQKVYWFRGQVPRSDSGSLQFNKAKPIRGILGKLVGGAATSKSRQKILAKLSGAPFQVVDEVPDSAKQSQMKLVMKRKFSEAYYRDLLLSTGDAVLHEKPLRGGPGAWTYKHNDDPSKRGGDWCGKILMEIRNELKE